MITEGDFMAKIDTPKIYLAGKMSGLSFAQMNDWREKANLLLYSKTNGNVHTENPVDYYNFEMDRSTYTDLEVKKFDLWLVENCDIVLVNLEHPDSIGTAIELHMAEIWGKPVIAFGDNGNVHPWMDLCITKKCKTLEEAVDHICKFYLKNI
jgi:nucleoside 2-deoxyribosyltransferase